MKIRRTLVISAWVLAGMTFIASETRGQVDPDWLRTWNEAQKARPLTLSPSGRIASKDEPGIPLVIHGRLFRPDGTSAAGVIVHAYHRDRDGFDFGPNDSSITTWRLQGWVETDTEGRFEFKTIRPAPDHLGREGSHVHFTLDSGDFGRQWAPSIFFADDALVTADQRRRSKEQGDFGRVRDVQIVDGVQHVNVMIQLKKKADFLGQH